MENKIQELTDKLLREGVDKGNAEAERIVAEANERAAQIVADAKKRQKRLLQPQRRMQQDWMLTQNLS
jgi:V/A-type H+-transporting ATPase subunit E